MAEFAREILQVNIEEEMKQSYLDYAMSVIVGRALPDVRDGLKPVHRRILYAMRELDLHWNRPFKKAARVCGDTTGKYHPHGDQAVYEALVRLAQTFSMRNVLVDGQGNFGSVDGDPPAAMRYTEVRLARIAHEMLADLDRDTVDFVPNYDDSEREPAVFPARLPNLLVNGSAGIAVGMATNIPPHNLGEVIDACVAWIENPDLGLPELMTHLPGPDFPTAGIINGSRGIREAYQTGRGRIYVRARTRFEEGQSGARQRIVVTELPYQVNKARLLEKIAELVKEKRVEGIAELRDESDKDGMRMVIELRRGAVPDVVLNNLYRHTQMQSVFGINLVALVDSQPRLLTLRQMIEAFVRHRREVVTRRTLFELRKARERAHVLEGLAVALANIDRVIALIRAARSPAEAKAALRHETLATGRGGGHGRTRRRRRLGRRRRACGLRSHRDRLPSLRAAGAGHPGSPPAPPHQPRAGQDPRRVRRDAAPHRGLERDPRGSRSHEGGGARRARRDQGPVCRSATHRDRSGPDGVQPRRPGEPHRGGGDLLALGLRQVAAGRRLRSPAAGGDGKDRDHHEGGGLHRPPLRRQHP